MVKIFLAVKFLGVKFLGLKFLGLRRVLGVKKFLEVIETFSSGGQKFSHEKIYKISDIMAKSNRDT